MQEKVKNFNDSLTIHKTPMSVSARLLDISSELGELNKEYLKATKYGTQNFVYSKDFELEFGDVIYSLFCLANEIGINAETALDNVLEKYKNRANKNQSIGSNN